MKPYSKPPYSEATPIWFGGGEYNWYIGGAVVPGYNFTNGNIILAFINNTIITNNEYESTGNKVAMSWRKVRSGELKTGDTNYAKINFNGELVDSTYQGTATFTANILDSQAEIGRCWQWINENRTSNSAIQIIRVYNRDITDEEVKINYEIDKYRFNLN